MKNILILLLFFTSTCYGQEVQTGMAYDPLENNVALLFTMSDEGGRTKNLDLMESVFKDKKLGFKSERHHNVSSQQIYSTVTEVSKNITEIIIRNCLKYILFIFLFFCNFVINSSVLKMVSKRCYLESLFKFVVLLFSLFFILLFLLVVVILL